jgi:CBS domain-containing protein
MNGEQAMNRSPKCLTEKDTARQAATLMRDENLGFVPICDESGRMTGTVTDRDIVVRLVAEDTSPNEPLRTFMSRNPVVCAPKEDLSAIEKLMVDNHKSRIVCVDDAGRPVGIISLSDIAQLEDSERTGTMLRAITEREARPR